MNIYADTMLRMDETVLREYITGQRNRVGDYWHPDSAMESLERILAALAEGWVNCDKCRSPGSCGLTENCFGGHKDNG